MKKFRSILTGLGIILFLQSCGFDISSDPATIELPNTYGINVEGVFETPAFILNHEVNFSEISIQYTIRKNDAFSANVKIYLSDDQTADVIQNGDDEVLINESLGISESEKSGSISSSLLPTILNNKQPYFVIGAQNLSISPISSIYIDILIRYKGTFSL